MPNPVSSAAEYFANKPRLLFLADSLGALLTAIMLWVVLRTFNTFFGMPPVVLVYLSAVALLFSIYSAACFLLLTTGYASFIKVIAYANLVYCLATLVLLLIYYPVLTWAGLAYFLGEAAVISTLVFVELKVAAGLR